ncbi:c-type cytochrome [Aquimarina sp. I32.4]|uniref:c-type cytochrome n=1 Tax=Aquimarina sp. I32.4 TaxID=2053903 RepID=UPI000CDED650|nr:c-type cytochrome [Aquimarina sp. I32.4]
MKKIHKLSVLSGVIALFSASCKSDKKEESTITIGTKKEQVSPYDLGKSVFNGKGKCYTCHKVDKKSIGPSVDQIMKVYAKEKGDLTAFLKQKADPIVDPETYAVMKTNFAIIQTFSEEELEAVKVYMTEVNTNETK